MYLILLCTKQLHQLLFLIGKISLVQCHVISVYVEIGMLFGMLHVISYVICAVNCNVILLNICWTVKVSLQLMYAVQGTPRLFNFL